MIPNPVADNVYNILYHFLSAVRRSAALPAEAEVVPAGLDPGRYKILIYLHLQSSIESSFDSQLLLPGLTPRRDSSDASFRPQLRASCL